MPDRPPNGSARSTGTGRRARLGLAGAGLAAVLSAPLLLAAPAGAVSGQNAPDDAAVQPTACRISAILEPNCGSWLGVSPTPHDEQTSYDEALGEFEERIDRTVDIVHYYTRGDTMFPTNSMLERANEPGRERLLMINWTPEVTWKAVADGEVDDYLTELAAHILRYYPDKFFLTLSAEPERDVNTKRSSGMTAKDYARFYRHTVDVLKANGVENTVTLMNYTGIAKWGDKSWYDALWPGNKYVDWIAEDPFAFGEEPGVWLSDFAGMVDRREPGSDWPGFYTWATTEHPGYPIMLGEWGVSEEAPALPSYKPDFFANTLTQLEQFPEIKGLVYWDHPGGTLVGETRVDSSSASLRQFDRMAGSRTLTKPGETYLGRPADQD